MATILEFMTLNDLANQISPMAIAFAFVAAVALPAYVVLRVLLKRMEQPYPPRWLHRPVRYHGFEVLALIWASVMLIPESIRLILKATDLFTVWNLFEDSERQRVVSLIAAPLWIALLFAWRSVSGADPFRGITLKTTLANIAYGLRGFLILTPVILSIHFLSEAILTLGGGASEKHPLTQFTADSWPDRITLILSASVVAPIVEELIFRGILLTWCRERVHRAMFVFAGAVVTLLLTRGAFLPAMLLLVDLVAMFFLALYGRQVWKRWPTRTALSVFVTSALFAVMHAAVWPTPWPLLFFGMGLAWMASRSGSVLPGIVTHSLFNTVSVVLLLRGGPQ
ncbi:hypothetical protein BH11PLA2_BH11PLA2_21920 [soil metagenome]